MSGLRLRGRKRGWGRTLGASAKVGEGVQTGECGRMFNGGDLNGRIGSVVWSRNFGRLGAENFPDPTIFRGSAGNQAAVRCFKAFFQGFTYFRTPRSERI